MPSSRSRAFTVSEEGGAWYAVPPSPAWLPLLLEVVPGEPWRRRDFPLSCRGRGVVRSVAARRWPGMRARREGGSCGPVGRLLGWPPATSGPVRDPRGCSSNSDATVNSTRLSISRASPFSGAQPRLVHLLTTPSSEFGVRWEGGASVSSAVTRQAHSAGFLRKGCFVTRRAVWEQECPGS